MSASGSALLEITDLAKTYPGQRALKGVSLAIGSAEIHGLIGENGSGKSTLIKCLAGLQAPDDGAELEIDGRRVGFPTSAKEARALGLAFVHQELGLCPTLSVAENLALGVGYPQGKGKQIQWGRLREWAREVMDQAFGASGRRIPVDLPVGELSVARQTLVAIARCVAEVNEDLHVLVLDEPTAALPAKDAAELVDMLRELRTERGLSVLLVSHRLTELLEVCDRISVLRDGNLVGSFSSERLTEADLVGHMLGEHPAAAEERARTVHIDENTPVALEVRDLAGGPVRGATFSVRAGEVIGIAGLLGSGRSSLLHLLFGAEQRTSGSVTLGSALSSPRTPGRAIGEGIALVPENRAVAGGVASMDIGENITLAGIERYFRRGLLRRRSEEESIRTLMADYDIRPQAPRRPFNQFSGGNQQKAVLAKWLSLSPRLLLLDEPVQGVDINARRAIMATVCAYAETSQAPVIVVDSDFENLAEFCDRVLVMRAGQIAREVGRDEMTRAGISSAVQSELSTISASEGDM